MRYYIGIDPGKQGGLGVVADGESVVFPTPMAGKDYDIGAMRVILKKLSHIWVFAVIERASARPGQGVVSMFEFGRGYGIWLGLLAALEIPYQVVHPSTWTKAMLKGAPGEGKERAYLVARKLFPKWQPKKKKERQLADALLLAEYARRINQGK